MGGVEPLVPPVSGGGRRWRDHHPASPGVTTVNLTRGLSPGLSSKLDEQGGQVVSWRGHQSLPVAGSPSGDRRDPVEAADRCAVAGPARPVRTLEDRPRTVADLDRGRHLAAHRRSRRGQGRLVGRSGVDRQRRLQRRPGPPARRRCPGKRGMRSRSRSARCRLGRARPVPPDSARRSTWRSPASGRGDPAPGPRR